MALVRHVAVLVLALGAGAPAHAAGDGVGVDPRAALAPTRLRASVGVVAAVGYVAVRREAQLAPGFSADVGAVFNDRISVAARGTFATVVTHAVLGLGVALDFALGPRAWLGVGLSMQYLGSLYALTPQWLGVGLPVQLAWQFAPPTRTEARRRGFYLSLEVTPGLLFVALPPSLPLTVSGVLGVGYGWW